MGAKNFRELRCWQRANDLRAEVHAICSISDAAKDFRFCNSFRDAIGSVCRNISEGFGRKSPGQIVQFFTYALASLNEVQDHLEECRIRKVLNQSRFEKDWDMAEHTRAMCLNFMKSHKARLAATRPGTERCYWYVVPRGTVKTSPEPCP